MFHKVTHLLSVSVDHKTIKGKAYGALTGILYLAPHTLSGYQVCPKASEGCKAACLFTSGRGIYNNIQQARINKTKWFFEDRESFMELLINDLEKLIKKAKKEKLNPVCRLNGTSDIAWEKIKCYRQGSFNSVMEAFPEIQFYDYTAISGRKRALSLKNYTLVFSLKENNDKDALKALNEGYNVAVVFDIKKTDNKPKTWSGYKVINGDMHDIRINEGKKKIVGLSPKGKARKDITGFVRSIHSSLKV